MFTLSESSLLGKGMYGLAEASRLIRVTPSRIRRWLKGYGYEYRGKMRTRPPVWKGQSRTEGRAITLTFLDMLEVRLVDLFRREGVSLATIRKVEQKAQKELGIAHPFVSLRFKTDGRKIFRELEEGTYEFLDNQRYFEKVIRPFLKDLDFDQDMVKRWWPLSKERQVVVDPERCYGKPIVFKGGVPTFILAQAFALEQDANVVGQWFEVEPAAVRDAVEFEEGLGRAA